MKQAATILLPDAAELSRTSAHFHARPEFLGTLVEGIAAFDEDGRLLAANPSGVFQLGLDAAALARQTLSSLFLRTPRRWS